MRKKLKSPVPLREILSRVLAAPLTSVFSPLASLQKDWPELVEKPLDGHSRPLKVAAKRLVIGVSGSVWAQELELMKPVLLQRIRERLPDLAIEEIRFQVL